METSLAKLTKQKDVLRQIGKLVIERAKGEEGEDAWISTLPKVCKGDFQDAEVLFGNETETEVTL